MPMTFNPSGIENSKIQMFGSNQARTKVEPTLWDQSAGALAYGAADVGEQLSGQVGDTFGFDFAKHLQSDLHQFKVNHPEYAPEEVEDTWGLITNPRAIIGRVAGGAPQVLLTVGAAMGGGPLAAAALSYAIESQRAYDNAKASGADEGDAMLASRTIGVVNAGFQMLQVDKLWRFAAGAKNEFLANVIAKALPMVKGETLDSAANIAMQALIGSLQGGADELLAQKIYGKEMEPGFWDRRAQELVGGTAAAAVFGYTLKPFHPQFSETETSPLSGSERQAVDTPGVQSIQKPNAPSLMELAEYDSNTIPKDLKEAPEGMWLGRTISKAIRSLASVFHSEQAGIKDGITKDIFYHAVSDIESVRKGIVGYFEDPTMQLKLKLIESGTDELIQRPDEDGFTPLFRAGDPTGVPGVKRMTPVGVLKDAVDLINQVRQYVGGEAEKVGVMKEGVGGTVPFETVQDSLIQRHYLPAFYDAINRGSGAVYDSILKAVNDHNSGDYGSIGEVNDVLQKYRQGMRRSTGSLEESRQIERMPQYVKVGAGWVQIMETDPVRIIGKTIDRQVVGAGLIRMFGQAALNNVGVSQVETVAKKLEVYQPITKEQVIQSLVNNKGFDITGFERTDAITVKDQVNLITKAGLYPHVVDEYTTMPFSELVTQRDALMGLLPNRVPATKKAELKFLNLLVDRRAGDNRFMSFDRVKKVAEIYGVQTKHDMTSLLAQIRSFDPTATAWDTPLGFKKYQKLQDAAKTVQGVKLNQTPDVLVRDIIDRIQTPVLESGLDRLLTEHGNEGGDKEAFGNLIKMYQGIPVSYQPRGFVHTAMRVMSDLIGTSQTSMMAIPNLPQTLVQVPRLLGAQEYFQAQKEVWKSPGVTAAQVRTLGGYSTAAKYLIREPGNWVERWSGKLADAVTNLLQGPQVNETNAIIAGQAGKIYAESLKNNGMSKTDIRILETLRVNPEEIQQIQAGQMTDHTFRKIVQNAVAVTQYHTDNPVYRSKLENVPMLRSIFAYNSYVLGTTRSLINAAGDLMAIPGMVKTGDIKGLQNVGTKTLLLMGGAVGAGAISGILRDAVKGSFADKQNETTLTLGLKAMQEVAILGAAQRTADSIQYSGHSMENLYLGLAPQLKALTDMTSALLGWGRYGRFNLDERLYATAVQNNPLAKAVGGSGIGFQGWVNELMYPEVNSLVRAESSVSKFEKDVLNKPPVIGANEQINPENFRIYESVARGEMKQAQDRIMSTMDKMIKKNQAISEPVTPQEILQGIRQSLVSRAPIKLSPYDQARWFETLSPEKRNEYMKAQVLYMNRVNALLPGSERKS